jgi:hypothetical protein
MPERLPEPDYPCGYIPRRVRTNGEIKLKGALIQVSAALAGDTIALEETHNSWRVWFYRQPIGLITPDARKVSPIIPG